MNTNSTKRRIVRGDFMRVVRGPLEGAEGSVIGMAVKIGPGGRMVTLVKIMQLNGNPIQLPRSYFEFADLRPKECLDEGHRSG